MSTVSVIESIIVIRLCSLQDTKMPKVVRFYAFDVIGPALWVNRSSSNHREDRGRNTQRQVHPDDQESAIGDTALSNNDNPKDQESAMGDTALSNNDNTKDRESVMGDTALSNDDNPKDQESPVGDTALSNEDHPNDQESPVGDTALSNVAKSSSELVDKINDVLVELRKVS